MPINSNTEVLLLRNNALSRLFNYHIWYVNQTNYNFSLKTSLDCLKKNFQPFTLLNALKIIVYN